MLRDARTCLSLTPSDDATAGEANDGWSFRAVSEPDVQHPFLKVEELQALGDHALGLMLSTMLQPPSSTALLILVSSCAALAKQRPKLLPRLATSLCELQRRLLARSPALAALAQAQLANAQRSLSSALLTVLKLEAARDAPEAEVQLVTSLQALGATDQLKHMYKQLNLPMPSALPQPSTSGGGNEGDAAGDGGQRAAASGRNSTRRVMRPRAATRVPARRTSCPRWAILRSRRSCRASARTSWQSS